MTIVQPVQICSIGTVVAAKGFPTPQGSQFDLDSAAFASRVVCSDCKVPNTMGSTLRINPSIPEGWKDKEFPHDKSSIEILG